MKKILWNKKYSGILWAIVVASAFVTISLLSRQFLSGTLWFIFNSILRFVFGFFILYIVKKLYDAPIKKALNTRGSKKALIAGSGFLIFFYII